MEFGQYFLPRELILQIFHYFMVKYLRISKDCNKFFSDDQFWIETYKKEKITVGYSLEGHHTNLMVHYFKIKNNSKLFWNKPLYKFNFTGDPFDYSGKINRKFYNTYQNYVLSFMEKNKRLITTFACHNPYHRKFVHHLCDIMNLGHSKNDFSLKDYGNFNDYEDRFYYYNNIERSFGLHINDNHDHTLGFDLCADCSLENKLWKNYLSYVSSDKKSQMNVKDLVLKLSQNTKRSLLKDNHGNLFSKQNPEVLLETIKRYNTTRK